MYNFYLFFVIIILDLIINILQFYKYYVKISLRNLALDEILHYKN